MFTTCLPRSLIPHPLRSAGDGLGIVTVMRPSLSSLVRAALLTESPVVLEAEAAADEAVVVKKPAVVNPVAEKEVKQAHAYVSTEKWRDAVMRTYRFLDSHDSVGDVVVVPLAISNTMVGSLLYGLRSGSDTRSWVVDKQAASSLLWRLRGNTSNNDIDTLKTIDISDLVYKKNTITVVPLVGMFKRTPDTLPSAWMLVHAMFDRGMDDLPACSEVSRDLRKLLASIDPYGHALSPIPLLLNCGWSENSFHMVSAAMRHAEGGSKRQDVMTHQDVMAHKMGSPVVGKRYKSHEDVTIRDEVPLPSNMISGLSYVRRPHGDIVSEIMTIAATKPSGFQPVLSRMPQIPDVIMFAHIFHSKDPSLEDLKKRIYLNNVGRRQFSMDADDRKMIEERILLDLDEIGTMTADLPDRLVHDLLDKVVFVTAG